MKYTIKNTVLTASFLSLGAELCELVDTEGKNYIWDANPLYWKRHAPILFPIVGKVLDNTYTVRNSPYTLSQHGFARDMDFSVHHQEDAMITFKLTSNDASKAMYPFDFVLYVTYTLVENRLEIAYKVENTDTQTIAFKIGAHPGFMCPLFEGESLTDYYLEFECEEDAKLMPLTGEGYFLHDESRFTGKTMPLSTELFANDALVLADFKSTWVAICSNTHNTRIKVSFEHFPFLGIWSPVTGAPFVCIEPWFGHADYVDERQELMRKHDLMLLDPDQCFSCMHAITIEK
ncbi:MAG: aldose 1-epimerase family protein [Cellulosilyticaceae bacterium]